MKNDGITPFFLFSLGTHLTMEKGTRLFIHGPEGGWGNLTLSSRWIQVTGTGEDSLKLGRKSKRQAPSKPNANANYANATKAQAQANAKCKHKHKRVNSQSFPWLCHSVCFLWMLQSIMGCAGQTHSQLVRGLGNGEWEMKQQGRWRYVKGQSR